MKEKIRESGEPENRNYYSSAKEQQHNYAEDDSAFSGGYDVDSYTTRCGHHATFKTGNVCSMCQVSGTTSGASGPPSSNACGHSDDIILNGHCFQCEMEGK